MNIKKQLEKDNQAIFDNYQKLKYRLTKLDDFIGDKESIIAYLWIISSIYEEQNQYYLIATEINTLYLSLVAKDKQVVNKEGSLLHLLFEASVISKRYGVAKKLLRIAQELGVVIQSSYTTRFAANKPIPIIIRIIVFIIALSSIERTVFNVVLIVSAFIIVEVIAFLFAKRK